jgi:hypothetical protein
MFQGRVYAVGEEFAGYKEIQGVDADTDVVEPPWPLGQCTPSSMQRA